MKAVTLGENGGKIAEIDLPQPQSNQILVKVRACGLNRSDLLETQGQYADQQLFCCCRKF